MINMLNMNKLFSLFIASLFLLVCTIFFTTCKKEYSYEGGPPNGNASGSAVFTLVGAGGNCTGSIVMGNYYVNTALDANDIVDLQVDVTKIGTYSVSTNSVNGFKFSASGTFTTTGVQTITLSGSGTPASAGNFNFTIPVGLGCSFTITVTATPIKMADFTLAGASNECTNANVKGIYISGKALAISNYVDVSVNVISVGAYTLSTDTIDGISFSASGTFTSLGIQIVSLPGSGTPDVPRNLTFTPITGSSHCTFNVTVVNPDPLATYVLESGFGNPSPCIYTVSGIYTAGIPLSNSNFVTIHVFVTVIGNYTIATNTINGITFSYTGAFTTTGAQLAQLNGISTPVTPGTYSFIPQIVGPHPLGGQACAFDIPVK